MRMIENNGQMLVNNRLRIIIIFFTISAFSCSDNKNKIELLEVKNHELNTIQKGALINNLKEGYWITLSHKKKIIIECYYVHGKMNGPIKLYTDNGKLMSQGYMKNDSTQGLWTYYFENGIINAKGFIQNGEKSGQWDFFIENGKLDKRIQYENGKEIILIDNHLSVPPPVPPAH